MTDAVARASGIKAGIVRRAVMLAGDLGQTALVALTAGEQGVSDVGLRGPAVQPMLASTAADVTAIDGPVSVEWKLDGIRIQVHRSGDEVLIFTRNLNDVTSRLAEICDLVREYLAESFVLDGEVIGTRPYFFDILHVDGLDVVDEPLTRRRAALETVAGPDVVRGLFTSDVVVAAEMLAESIAAGHEGVMIKDASSRYEAGRRGKSWRKVKPVVTLDLVVLAAEWGHGRRSGMLSNLHLGAVDPDGGPPIMVGKTFKGLTDKLLDWQTGQFLEREVRRDGIVVYVEPNMVIEIAVDGVQSSTRYSGGVVLRFARVRRYRSDKSTAEADTIETVRALLSPVSE